jgi:hypothetical protein
MQREAKPTEPTDDEDKSPLTISPEKVCFIIIKAKEFDAKDEVTEPDPGSNPSDDMELVDSTRGSGPRAQPAHSRIPSWYAACGRFSGGRSLDARLLVRGI